MTQAKKAVVLSSAILLAGAIGIEAGQEDRLKQTVEVKATGMPLPDALAVATQAGGMQFLMQG